MENEAVIKDWIHHGTDSRLKIDFSSPELVGYLMRRISKSKIGSQSVTVILQRAKDGFYVLTAYVR